MTQLVLCLKCKKVLANKHRSFVSVTQPDSPEYKAACKLWDLYLRTKNEFVQKGDAEDDDDDDDGHDNQGTISELVSISCVNNL